MNRIQLTSKDGHEQVTTQKEERLCLGQNYIFGKILTQCRLLLEAQKDEWKVYTNDETNGEEREIQKDRQINGRQTGSFLILYFCVYIKLYNLSNQVKLHFYKLFDQIFLL